jgi:hypothetical protein
MSGADANTNTITCGVDKMITFAQLRRYIPSQPIGMKISTGDVRENPPVQMAKMNQTE